jgi:hypothetical protein
VLPYVPFDAVNFFIGNGGKCHRDQRKQQEGALPLQRTCLFFLLSTKQQRRQHLVRTGILASYRSNSMDADQFASE